MWLKRKGNYNLKNVENKNIKLNPVPAVVYNTLSVNTRNSLDLMSKQNPDISIIRRRSKVVLPRNELEKIEEAITKGFKETLKSTNEAEIDSVKEIKKPEIIFDDHLIELEELIKRYETNVLEGLKLASQCKTSA